MSNKVQKYLAVVIITAFGLVPFTLSSCKKQGGGSAGGGNGKIVVGFSQMENDGPWRIAETSSMKSEASRLADKFP